MDSCSSSLCCSMVKCIFFYRIPYSPNPERYGCDFKWPVSIYHSSDCKLYEGRGFVLFVHALPQGLAHYTQYILKGIKVIAERQGYSDFKQMYTRKILIKERSCSLIRQGGIQSKYIKDKEGYFKMKKSTAER